MRTVLMLIPTGFQELLVLKLLAPVHEVAKSRTQLRTKQITLCPSSSIKGQQGLNRYGVAGKVEHYYFPLRSESLSHLC